MLMKGCAPVGVLAVIGFQWKDSRLFIYLLRDPWAAKPWIALFHFDDRLDEFGRWAFGVGFSFTAS